MVHLKSVSDWGIGQSSFSGNQYPCGPISVKTMVVGKPNPSLALDAHLIMHMRLAIPAVTCIIAQWHPLPISRELYMAHRANDLHVRSARTIPRLLPNVTIGTGHLELTVLIITCRGQPWTAAAYALVVASDEREFLAVTSSRQEGWMREPPRPKMLTGSF